jgi:hypothetical protein
MHSRATDGKGEDGGLEKTTQAIELSSAGFVWANVRRWWEWAHREEGNHPPPTHKWKKANKDLLKILRHYATQSEPARIVEEERGGGRGVGG